MMVMMMTMIKIEERRLKEEGPKIRKCSHIKLLNKVEPFYILLQNETLFLWFLLPVSQMQVDDTEITGRHFIIFCFLWLPG